MMTRARVVVCRIAAYEQTQKGVITMRKRSGFTLIELLAREYRIRASVTEFGFMLQALRR
jgi:hypothetical protein